MNQDGCRTDTSTNSCWCSWGKGKREGTVKVTGVKGEREAGVLTFASLTCVVVGLCGSEAS